MLESRARLSPCGIQRRAPILEVLSPSSRAHTGDFESAAATKCVSPATMAPFQTEEKSARTANLTGGGATLKLRARLNPCGSPRRASLLNVLSPSLRAHMGNFGSAAATKCVSPATLAPFQTSKINARTSRRATRRDTRKNEKAPSGGDGGLLTHKNLGNYRRNMVFPAETGRRISRREFFLKSGKFLKISAFLPSLHAQIIGFCATDISVGDMAKFRP